MKDKKLAKQVEKFEDDDLNVTQRQATNYVVKTILITVVSLLVTFVSLFVIFNFVYPTISLQNDASYALSSDTTYYKNGDSFYTIESSTMHYRCTNSRHTETPNDYTTRNPSGTCYSSPSGSYYSHRCTEVTGSHSWSRYGDSHEQGEMVSEREYYQHYASSRSGSIGAYYWECDTCGATTSGHWYDSGAHSWGQCRLKTYATYYCPLCEHVMDEQTIVQTTCPATYVWYCSHCNVKKDSSNENGACSSNVTGYKCSYCNQTFSTNSTDDCTSRPIYNYYGHSMTILYLSHVYKNIDTGSTVTATSTYDEATGYTVTFNANGGSGTMNSQYFLHGHSQTLSPNTFTRTDYKFKGWATSSSGAVVYADQAALNLSSGGDMTLYASWEATTIRVTVTLNNQSATTAGTTSVTATCGAAMPSITPPTKNGYTFGGYYTGTNGSGTRYYYSSGSSAKTSDLTVATTLYAKWTAAYYKITVNSNGGTGGSTSTGYTFSPSASQTKTITLPTRTGYTLSSWSSSGSSSSLSVSGTTVTIPANCYGAATITANWTPITYTVNYNANGGSGTMSASTHIYDTNKNLTTNTFTRTGYNFRGWALTSSGGVTYQDGQSIKNLTTTNAGTINLYAVWRPVTVVLKLNATTADDKGTTAVNLTYNESMPNITVPTKMGYYFKGYYIDNTLIYGPNGNPVSSTSTYTANVEATASFEKWYSVESTTGSTTTCTVCDSADTNLKRATITFQPSEGHVITAFSFDNAGWFNIEKNEGTLRNSNVAVGVTYYASQGSNVLVIEFVGIETTGVKIYLQTTAGSYSGLSAN